MSKLSKTAKALDNVAKFLFWLAAGAAAFLLGYALLQILVAGPESLISSQVDLGIIQLTLLPEHLPQGAAAYVPGLLKLLAIALNATVICWSLRILRGILAPMVQSAPFAGSVSRDLRKLGKLTLAAGIVLTLVSLGFDLATQAVYNIPSLLYTDKFSHLMVNYDYDLTFLIVAGLLFLLSFIFRYGEELQQLSDETL